MEEPVIPQPAAYRFFLEFRDEADRLLGDEAVSESEFDRAIYKAYFEGVRRGVFPEYAPSLERARIEPRFAGIEGEPDAAELRAAGFSVVLPVSGGNEYRLDFSPAYFASRANRRKLQLVRSEQLPQDAVLRYRLTAFLDDLEIAQPRQQPIRLGSASVTIPIRDTRALQS
ncbi:MAG: hypothetical protein AB7V46_20075, partial [Thermomicrobiales bacterium]